MKSTLSEAKKSKSREPFEVIKEVNSSVPIYAHTNIIPQRDPQTGAILYDSLPDGNRKARVKYHSVIYAPAYYQGLNRVRKNF